MKHYGLYSLVFLVLFALPLRAQASEASTEQTPIAFLKMHDGQVNALLKNAPTDSLSPALQDSIKDRINAAFDFSELSKLALGAYWKERTPEQQAHFIKTFSGIIREQNFDSFLRYYREGNITYVGEEVKEDRATVTASIPLERETVTISYGLHKRENQWRVYNLTIDGASTAEGNRRRYERYIKKKSYEQLIAQLDKQLARLLESKK